MAEGKKSFVLYCDLIHQIDHLTNEEKGILFQHLLEYVNDLDPELEDRIILGVWKPIKMQLKRDLKKYESYIEKQRVNGAKGGRPKKTQKTQPFFKKPKKADTVNDNDNDNVTVNDNEIIDKSITIINNNVFLNESLNSTQWIETTCMQNKVDADVVKIYLNQFNDHLIVMEEQKNSTREFKQHFTHWLKKQDLSNFRKKVTGRTNQI